MIKKLKSFLGFKEYLVEITWDSSGEKEIIPVRAWSSDKAFIKVSNLIDVVNKAEMTILNSRKYKAIRFCAIDSSGVAKKVDKKEQ